MKPKPRVYVTQRLPAPVVAELERSFELARDPQGAEGLVTTPADPVDAELLDTVGSQLRLVANFAVGYDNVDLDAAVRRGIVVTNTPDVLTRAVAEFTVAAVLALLRRVVEGDRFVRSGRPWSWATTFMLGTGVDGKSLGCVGFGRIGRETARLARCLGMEVAYTNGSGALPGVDAQWLPLRELLGVADVVSIHCPLTPETRHLIGRDELAAMQPAAVLVNTSRGPIVDERALADALRRGEIAGAALDVFEHEPDVTPELLALENVVLTPHVGSATHAAREAMGMLCVEALRAVLLEGRRPANAVTA